jgi:hypothetical protein
MVAHPVNYESHISMLLDPTDTEPILVVVAAGRYECFSTHSAFSMRDAYLMGLLQGMGGVNEKTEDGTYHFNLEQLDGNNTVIHMTLVQELHTPEDTSS